MAASRKRRERRLFAQLQDAEQALADAIYSVSVYETQLRWEEADDHRAHADRCRARVNSLESQYREAMRSGLVAA